MSTAQPSAAKYKVLVKRLLDLFLVEDTRMDFMALARVLGSAHTDRESNIVPVTPADELVVRQTWIDLLHRSYPQTLQPRMVERFILDGLLTNDRWRALLENTKDAYTLVELVTTFLGRTPGHRKERPSAADVREQLQEAFAPWLPPEYVGPMTERDLAVAFFGGAWCSIIYDGRSSDSSIAELIAETCPDIVPGRLLKGAPLLAESLPTLE
jgi:hypothetical protein